MTKQLAVAFVGPVPDEPGAGGMARVIANLVQHVDEDISVQILPSMDVRQRFKGIDRMPKVVRGLWQMRNQNAVAHVHMGPAGSLFREGSLAVLAAAMGLPTVVTVHASRLEQNLGSPVLRRWGRFVLRRVDLVHALGPRGMSSLSKVVDPGHIVVIPNGVPTNSQQAPTEARNFVFVGEVGLRKGVDVLIEAWQRFAAKREGVALRLVGPRHPDFEMPSIDSTIEVVGSVEPEEVVQHILWSDVGVLPSRAEAFPMFLLESLSHSRPVVATKVGDVPSLVGDSGIIIEPGDVGALADAFDLLYGMDGKEIKSLATVGARRVASEFSLEAVGEAMSAVYFRLAGCSTNNPSLEGCG